MLSMSNLSNTDTEGTEQSVRIKADLHGTIYAYDCRMRFLFLLLASWKNRILFLRYQIACRYDCRRVLKHVSKAHDILRVVRDNRKQVVGLIYTKRFMS